MKTSLSEEDGSDMVDSSGSETRVYTPTRCDEGFRTSRIRHAQSRYTLLDETDLTSRAARQSCLGLTKSLTGVFQGLLLFSLLACDTLVNYRLKWRRSGGA